VSLPPISIDDGQSIQINNPHKKASNLEVIEELNEDRSPAMIPAPSGKNSVV
jgi:hypothetical protein